MKQNFIIFSIVFVFISMQINAQIPETWTPSGIGGGGSLFSPSINPANEDEFYFACDMSEMFHTTDFGNSYEIIDFNKLRAFPDSRMRFTNNPNILYCIDYKTEVSLISKSTDGGDTWANVTGLPVWEDVYRLYVDYENPDILVANFWSEVLFSGNGGNSFQTIHSTAIGGGAFIAGVFFNLPDVFIATNEGMLVSHNSGADFQFEDFPGIPAGQACYSFAGGKQNDTLRFFTITADPDNFWNGHQGWDYWELIKGVYRMDYSDGIWEPAMNGIDINTDFLMFVGMAENDINNVYLAGSSINGFPTVFKTTDGGETWNPVFLTENNQNIFTGWCGYYGDFHWWWAEVFFGIDVAKFNSDKVLVTDFGFIHKTDDGGVTWQQAYVSEYDQNPAGSPTPKGRDYHSTGLENTSVWCMLWIDEENIFAGYSDIRGIRSKDGGQSWSFDYTGHDQNTMYWIIKHPVSGFLYAATSTVHDIYQSYKLKDSELEYSGAEGKVIFSTDGGANWQDLHDFQMPVYWTAYDPNDPEILYASVINHASGFGGIYKTSDLSAGSASSWNKLNNPNRTQGHPASIIVLDDGKVLTSWSARRNTAGQFTNSSGVFLYDPGANSWEDLSDPNMVYWTKDIMVDPNDPQQNTWYACVFSGWGGPSNERGGLYKTTDRGQSWERILIVHRVESCTINPLNQDEMFVSTETEGLWYCNNLNSSVPVFMQVSNYDFMHPLRIFFNPFDPAEIRITNFGNGLRKGITSPPVQQIVELPQGWSGISSFLTPLNPDIENMFEPLTNNLIILSDLENIYWPDGGINTIINWNTHNGYIIKTSSAGQLTISGTEDNDKTVNLEAGWNLMPVLSFCPVSINILFTTQEQNLKIVKEVAGWEVYWPEMNIFTLTEFTTGKSYFVCVEQNCQVTFPDCK